MKIKRGRPVLKIGFDQQRKREIMKDEKRRRTPEVIRSLILKKEKK